MLSNSGRFGAYLLLTGSLVQFLALLTLYGIGHAVLGLAVAAVLLGVVLIGASVRDETHAG